MPVNLNSGVIPRMKWMLWVSRACYFAAALFGVVVWKELLYYADHGNTLSGLLILTCLAGVVLSLTVAYGVNLLAEQAEQTASEVRGLWDDPHARLAEDDGTESGSGQD